MLALLVLVASLSLDFNNLTDVAYNIINTLWPVFIVPMGVLFGVRLIGWIMDELRTVVPNK
jgi:hypothetical protein